MLSGAQHQYFLHCIGFKAETCRRNFKPLTPTRPPYRPMIAVCGGGQQTWQAPHEKVETEIDNIVNLQNVHSTCKDYEYRSWL